MTDTYIVTQFMDPNWTSKTIFSELHTYMIKGSDGWDDWTLR